VQRKGRIVGSATKITYNNCFSVSTTIYRTLFINGLILPSVLGIKLETACFYVVPQLGHFQQIQTRNSEAPQFFVLPV